MTHPPALPPHSLLENAQDALLTLEAHVLGNVPDVLTSPPDPELALLAGHLTLLGWQLARHTPPPSLPELGLILDLAVTFGTLHPAGVPLARALEHLHPDVRYPTPLTATEVHAAAEILLACAERLQLPVPDALREGGLA